MSSQLRIAELSSFIGKQVEITITETVTKKDDDPPKKLFGVLSEYKSPENMVREKTAWELAANEKHGNN